MDGEGSEGNRCRRVDRQWTHLGDTARCMVRSVVDRAWLRKAVHTGSTGRVPARFLDHVTPSDRGCVFAWDGAQIPA